MKAKFKSSPILKYLRIILFYALLIFLWYLYATYWIDIVNNLNDLSIFFKMIIIIILFTIWDYFYIEVTSHIPKGIAKTINNILLIVCTIAFGVYTYIEFIK